MEVIRIPERESSRKNKRKIRVAAYCRVSTLMEEQESSYLSQIAFYTDYIAGHKGWILAGIYADEGISGTGTRKRAEFNRMIRDCMDHKIDLVVTKSISRFARNTLDCLRYIRMLKEEGIAVYFEKEAINTLDAKGEVLLTIMASLAQQESLSISQNVKMGIRYQYAQGKVRVNCSRFLGYSMGPEGNLVIVPEEAETVKRIFREYTEGKSPSQIARELTKEGIRTGGGATRWYDSGIRFILSNEKYMGDALLQKGYVVDYLTKKRAANHGILPQYYVENNHPPIIDKETFLAVQRKLFGSTDAVRQTLPPPEGGRYPFSGRILCSCCGNTYRRVKANGLNKYTTWRCKARMKQARACQGRILKEKDLLHMMEQAAEQVFAREHMEIRILCSEDLIRKILEKITVYEDHVEILLRDGAEILLEE